MKKISFTLAMALVLAFMSCQTWTAGSANEPTQFEGRWLNLAVINDHDFIDFSYTFSGGTFVFRQLAESDMVVNGTVSGTFKFTDNEIQFKSGRQKWTQAYTLTGNELNTGRYLDKWTPLGIGTFIKQ